MSVFDKTSAAAKKPEPVTYKHTAAVAAHELGHATHFENPVIPRSIGHPLEMVFGIGCGVGSAIAGMHGRPVIAGGLALAGMTPTLIEEFRASKDGLKALRESGKLTPRQQEHAKTELTAAFGTYGTSALSSVASAVAMGLADSHPVASQVVGAGATIGGALAIWQLWERMKKYDKLGKRFTPAETNELREQMGVKAKIRRGAKNVNFYAPPFKNRVMRWLLEHEIKDHLEEPTNTKKDIKDILDHGGVVLEGHHCKMAALRGYNAALALVA